MDGGTGELRINPEKLQFSNMIQPCVLRDGLQQIDKYRQKLLQTGKRFPHTPTLEVRSKVTSIDICRFTAARPVKRLFHRLNQYLYQD